MPWDNDIFYYTASILRKLAGNYERLYEFPESDMRSIAEFKADFDIALDSIGHGHWTGLVSRRFNDYHHFGRRQRVIIARIIGIHDYHLQSWGFPEPRKLRSRAFHDMLRKLNEK